MMGYKLCFLALFASPAAAPLSCYFGFTLEKTAWFEPSLKMETDLPRRLRTTSLFWRDVNRLFWPATMAI